MKIQITEFNGSKDDKIILYAESFKFTEGRLYYWPSFYHNGHEWRCESTTADFDGGNEQVEENVKRLFDAIAYNSCLTQTGRVRPSTDIQRRVIKDIRQRVSDSKALTDLALRQLHKDVKTLEGDGIKELQRELEAYKKKAESADINTLIMNSVVEAVTPQICETIKQRVGALAECLPTRLEVKLGDEVRDAGEAVRHEKFETILNIVAAGLPVWLVGEAGTGKSVLCEQIADAIGAEYRYSGAILDEFTGLKGFIDANGKKHGTQFTEALELADSGTDVVFCMDECDGSTPEVLLVLNNLLSGGAVECMGKCYRMNDHLHIIACGNTNGRGGSTAYTRSIIDSATLDRFFMVDVDYSPKIDLVSAGGDEALASFASCVRRAARRSGIDLLVTYRAISRMAKMEGKVDIEDLLHGALFRGIDGSDMRTLEHRLEDEGFPRTNKWFEAMKKMARR